MTTVPVEDDVIDQAFLTMEAAASLFLTFKNEMVSHFPFVWISPQMTANESRREKPYLFLAILTAASFGDMPLQRALDVEFKKALASRMITNGNVSFDLLQALLVYLAWCVTS